jgi:anti-sigma factor RsiW
MAGASIPAATTIAIELCFFMWLVVPPLRNTDGESGLFDLKFISRFGNKPARNNRGETRYLIHMEMQIDERHLDRRFSQILKAYAHRHNAPVRLRRKVAASLRETAGTRRSNIAALVGWTVDRIVPLAAGFSAASVLNVAALYHQARVNDDQSLGQQLVSAQVRSIMPAAPVTASASPAEIRSWLASKLSFSPSVADLAADGYQLAAGRIEHVSGRSVAAIQYSRGEHVVNVLACPLRGGANARAFGRDGYNIVGWTDSQLQYWAVSDLNAAELARFAVSYRRATGKM